MNAMPQCSEPQPRNATYSPEHQAGATQRILHLVIEGGFLDGLRIAFVAGLNCIIGGRGTGKTTLVEFIRYALDMGAADGGGDKPHPLVRSNLGGGRVWLQVETTDGGIYSICRSADEPPVVFDADNRPTDIVLRGGRFFTADIFSQNQVEVIADAAASQLQLLDSFVARRVDMSDWLHTATVKWTRWDRPEAVAALQSRFTQSATASCRPLCVKQRKRGS